MPAGRHHPNAFLKTLNSALGEQFEVEKPLILGFWNPSLYLDLDLIRTHELDVSRVEFALAEKLMNMPGFALALTRTQLLRGQINGDAISQQVLRAFHPRRSGNVMVVQSPSWYLYKDSSYAAMHGSPYSYDTYVPVMFAGAGIRPARVERKISPRDVAPTICAILGIKPPSGSVGTALSEVLAGTTER